jgi:hypothetical protein
MGVSEQRHHPAVFYPRGKESRYPFTEGWVGVRAGLDTEVREKMSCLCRGSKLDRLVNQSVARYYTKLPGSHNATSL